MYAGHFAAGLALKAKEPDAPFWGILLGVGFLDLLFGPFVLLGIEHVALTPHISPGFSLDHIDWSHSLMMSLIWAGFFAALWFKQGKRVATVMGVAVFSHFVLDLPMHPADLALWPGADTHWGLGLWQRLPNGWWFLELGFVALAGAYYVQKARASTKFGRLPIVVWIVVLLLHVSNSPWLSPL